MDTVVIRLISDHSSRPIIRFVLLADKGVEVHSDIGRRCSSPDIARPVNHETL